MAKDVSNTVLRMGDKTPTLTTVPTPDLSLRDPTDTFEDLISTRCWEYNHKKLNLWSHKAFISFQNHMEI